MILRGIDFGTVWGASGVQGFFGEGYAFHKLWRPFGLDFSEMTFVAKTTTLDPRLGNMALHKRTFKPKKLFPDCVVVKPIKGVVLNAVGLSGPGAKALFEKGLWQKRERPFLISFMSVAETPEERLKELKKFVDMFAYYLYDFRVEVALQINFSCPNTDTVHGISVEEILQALDIASVLDIPLVPKLNILFPVEDAKIISEYIACDGLCISNTLPWGSLPDKIDWVALFGSATSPLARYGGGGLSGKPLLPLLLKWLTASKGIIKKPINAGGGILSEMDAHRVMIAGASSIFLGSIAILRPWRVRNIIQSIQRSYQYEV